MNGASVEVRRPCIRSIPGLPAMPNKCGRRVMGGKVLCLRPGRAQAIPKELTTCVQLTQREAHGRAAFQDQFFWLPRHEELR